MTQHTTLFKTVHGSHLYGLAHAASDNDYYEVIQRPSGARKHYAKQSIVDEVDTMRVNFTAFVNMANEGVPQALEAMFSQMSIGTDHILAYRQAYRVGITTMLSTYRRTIANFVVGDPQGKNVREVTDQMRYGDFKRRRHAVRLALNFGQAAQQARFNPTLTPVQAEFATDLARNTDNYLSVLLSIFPYLNSSELLSRGYKHGPKMVPSGFLTQMVRDGFHTSTPADAPEESAGMLLLVPDTEGSGHRIALTESLGSFYSRMHTQSEVPCFFVKRQEEAE